MIATHSGRLINPFTCFPDEIEIEDIAWALSGINRFLNHTIRPLSVAEHSVNVWTFTQLALTPDDRQNEGSIGRQALLHDATEAFLADLPSPVKRQFPAYKVAEDRLFRVIADRFRFPSSMHPLVKDADKRMLLTEARDLLPGGLSVWGEQHPGGEPYHDFALNPLPHDPQTVRLRFMRVWSALEHA